MKDNKYIQVIAILLLAFLFVKIVSLVAVMLLNCLHEFQDKHNMQAFYQRDLENNHQ
jgi:hypothetical protein